MPIKIEEVSPEDNNKNKPETATPQIDNTALILAMQKEIEEMKAERLTNQVSGNNGDVSEVLKSLVSQLKEKPDADKYGGEGSYVNPDDIDHDDIIDTGVAFFCHQVYYVIVDDIRQGHAVQTPFKNKIVFNYQSTKKSGSGMEAKLHNLSVYVSFSKKEVEWLKNHKGYGSIFFENHTAAMSIDGRKAAKIARIMGVLQRYDASKVVNIAKGHKLPQSSDLQSLRIMIANKQADEEMAKEETSNAIRVKESIIESEIIPIKE